MIDFHLDINGDHIVTIVLLCVLALIFWAGKDE